MEAGTLNIPGIYGLFAALDSFDPTAVQKKEQEQSALFLSLLREIPNVRLMGSWEPSERVTVFSIVFTGMDQALAAIQLEERFGLLTRCGLHCSPEAHKALGSYPQGTVRFSFGRTTSDEEIQFVADAIKTVALS